MSATRARVARDSPGRRVPLLPVLLCLVLVAGVVCVYWQSTGHAFLNYDDNEYVTENPVVSGGLTLQGVFWAFTSFCGSNWHPLTMLSHMVDVQVFGLNPAGHHGVNVALHALNATLLFLLLRSMTGSLWKSFLVAALWAIHPLRVESVAWVAERKDLLSGLFFLLTLFAYTRYVRRPPSPFPWPSYLLVLFLFALGLMSKPMLVTLPLVLLLLDFWPLHRLHHSNLKTTLPRLLLEKAPLLALSATSAIITITAQRSVIGYSEVLPASARLGNAAVSLLLYLKETLWPAKLALLYPFSHAWPLWEVALCLAAVCGISIAVLRKSNSHPYLAAGWFWYLVMLLPVIGIVKVGAQTHADRYTYLPQIGILIALVWLAGECLARRPFLRMPALVGSTVALGLLLVVAKRQDALWHDGVTLWKHTLAVTERNVVAYNSLGTSLSQAGQHDEAVATLGKALALNPEYAEAEANLGSAEYLRGNFEAAIAHYARALEIHERHPAQIANFQAGNEGNLANAHAQAGRLEEAASHYRRALILNPNLAWIYRDLGHVLLQLGRREEAGPYLRRAAAMSPGFARESEREGYILLRQGNAEGAIASFERSLEIDPENAGNEKMLGLLLARQGRAWDALPYLRRAAEREPNSPELLNFLGNALLMTGEGRGAAAEYEASLKIDPAQPATLRSLSGAYATAGNFPKAIAAAERGIPLAESQGKAPLAAVLRSDLTLYKAGKLPPIPKAAPKPSPRQDGQQGR